MNSHSDPIAFSDPGEVPVLDWLDTQTIDVDARYQRGLDEARVERILASFAWDSFGAIVVAPAGDRYHCIDGQHRLEAAKRHPKIAHVPAVIITSRAVEGEAATFVTVNRDRKNVSQLEMYWAELAAGNPEAQTVAKVAERTNIRILRSPTPAKDTKPGDTMAIGAVRALIDARGAMRAREMLAILSGAALAPISAHHIRAVERLITDPEFRDQMEADSLLESLAGSNFEAEAKVFASTHRLPHWRAFASVWFKATRKKRKATGAAPAAAPTPQGVRPSLRPVPAPVRLAARPAPQTAHTTTTARVLGDPEPGRSALDQRGRS